MASSKKTAGTKKTETATIASFHESLILAKWALNFFGEGSFEKLKKTLGDSALEGLDTESGNTKFFHTLTRDYLIPLNGIDAETLCQYDRNIVAHWTEITERRNAENGHALNLKYFQWLSLLVTELYLDNFFNRKSELLSALNGEIAKFNAGKPTRTQFSKIEESDLNKIAFWEATGAGKTLLLHVNIKQYLHYAGTSRRPARIILLTPNEGLSIQHLAELRISGFTAEMLSDDNALLSRGAQVGVIDAVKLISADSTKSKGEKSMFAESFEGENLVLVDEGHNGSTAENGERRKVREQLCRDGFSFEYSATFGQAVAKKQGELRELYAKAILFDYSYKFFHADGYGKDAMILNMPDKSLKALPDTSQNARTFEYLCACLLAFFQQRKIFKKFPEIMAEYGIEKPLCVFVGNSVNAGNKKKTGSEDEVSTESDVLTLIKFLAEAVRVPAKTKKVFNALLNDESLLTDAGWHNLSAHQFLFLKNEFGDGEAVYKELLEDVFNATTGTRLVARHLSAAGEIALCVGSDSPAFALINIGDTATFAKTLAEKAGTVFSVETDALAGSIFHNIEEKNSSISFLVGSKKFTEGWSSWRVSTMGLMNVGRSEGTQIIQLFGRGVRLRGRGFSLKRSTHDERRRRKIEFLEKLETLNIFGIRSEYMGEFKKYLQEEGVSTLDEILEIRFAPWKNLPPAETVLKKPAVRDGFRLNQKNGFKTQELTLFEIPRDAEKCIKRPCAVYSDFAVLQKLLLKTADKNSTAETAKAASVPPSDVKIDKRAFPFFNWDKIYREILAYKNERGYRNLRVSRERLREFCSTETSWYSLFARKESVTFDSFEKLHAIEKIFKTLLFNYTDAFYKTLQRLFEDKHMTLADFDSDAIPAEYVFSLPHGVENFAEWETRLKELQKLVEAHAVPALKKWNSADLVAIVFDRHLYSPLIYKSNEGTELPFKLQPLSFDAPSEKQFVEDLQKFYEENPEFFAKKDLYLMRNASNKSRGIGFAQAGNFYPDFLMWLVDKTTGTQYLTFVDPKGLRNSRETDAKLNFYKEIKTLQKTIRDETGTQIVLNSVILSATAFEDLLGTSLGKNELEERNIFFLNDGGGAYLPKLFAAAQRE